MLKKILLASVLFVSVLALSGQHYTDKDMTPRQVMERANEYYHKGELTEALEGFNLLVNTPVKSMDALEAGLIIEAHNKAAIVNYHEGNYRHAYELLARALSLSEETGHAAELVKIYTNIGNIYYRFEAYERARTYYLRALSMQNDSVSIAGLYNNIGMLEAKIGLTDSALEHLREAMEISTRNDRVYLSSIFNSMASLHRQQGRYDRALSYYRRSLAEAERQNRKEEEADNLSDIGGLFMEMARLDSARYYIELSNNIATENNMTHILTQNRFILSKIAKSRGAVDEALDHFERYAYQRDSLFNAGHLDEINNIERMYESSKVDKQMEQLAVERQIKERTIKYQIIAQLVMLAGLIAVSIMFLVNLSQKRKLNAAYKALVDKNQALIGYGGRSLAKNKKDPSPLDLSQEELLGKIQAVMEDSAAICDPKFSINVLAGLVQSNHQYVSQVINSGLNKNFRSFLNGYRIREAQRLFSEPDSGKFTIESVALRVGFRSRSAFREAFTEVTGVNPTFYLRSLQDK